MSKILILGYKGMLGGELIKVFGDEAVGWDRENGDMTHFEELKKKIEDLKPSAIVNCIAYNDVDRAEQNKELAFLLNAELPKNLAIISKGLNVPLIHFSTNYVFDGEVGEYTESAKPNPLSVYAQSKYEGEQEIEKNTDNFYIIRTAVLFGVKGQSEASKKSFVEIMLDLSQKTDTIKAVTDEVNSLTYAHDLAWAVRVLLSQKFEAGIYHLTNSGQASWYDFAKEIFNITGKKVNLTAISGTELNRAAKRPKKAVLLNTKFIQFRPWQEALQEFLQ